MAYLKRKIDKYLKEWKESDIKKPLIIKGARQIGKTSSILHFGRENYDSVIYINFVDEPLYKEIFEQGYNIDNVMKNISLLNQNVKIVPGKTLIVFDEIQEYPDAMTSLKFFSIDGKYDVICSGSLLGINYKDVSSISVGYKIDYKMNSMDFEEFLWAKGYTENQIDEFYINLMERKPFSDLQYNVLYSLWKEYLVVSGMPAAVAKFLESNLYVGIDSILLQIIEDYKADMRKYVMGFDKMKLLNTYNSALIQLGDENKKFQISKIKSGARSKDYMPCIEWLCDTGILMQSFAIKNLEFPLKANVDTSKYKLYFADSGILLYSLDKESKDDIIIKNNQSTYKGGVYENIIAEALYKSGIELYYYKKEDSTLEEDFITRDKESIVPIEVKSKIGTSKSLRALIDGDKYENIKYGIKIQKSNISFENNILTMPHFAAFMLKKCLELA